MNNPISGRSVSTAKRVYVLGYWTGSTAKLSKLVIPTRRVRPKRREKVIPTLSVLFLKGAIPRMVENSAIAFMDALTKSPLLRAMARKAMADVVAPDPRP